MDPNTISTNDHRLRGGAFEDGYGYNPNFTRRISRADFARDPARNPEPAAAATNTPGCHQAAPTGPSCQIPSRRAARDASASATAFSPYRDEEGGGGEPGRWGEESEPAGRFGHLSTPPWTGIGGGGCPRWRRSRCPGTGRGASRVGRSAGGWRPTRAGFEMLYSHLCVRARDFGGWFAKRVAKQDNHVGGWDVLLKMEKHRRYLVIDVIGKVLEMCVFDELLFSAEGEQKEMLEAQDRCTFDMEGECPLVPLGFYRIADRFTYSLDYMSIAIRWSRDIFRFSSPFLGEVWDTDQQHVDNAVYTLSKSRTERDDKVAEQKHKSGLSQSRKAGRSAPLTIISRGWASITAAMNSTRGRQSPAAGQADEGDAGRGRAFTSWRAPARMGKVQIVVWPMLQRFATTGQIDPISGAAEGQHITTLLKAQCVYYSGRINQPAEQPEDQPALDEWIREKNGTASGCLSEIYATS
ncbi:hypothetical protein MMYC01_204136 [Madurella mycetomatis]|uniref:Uncharacterized protein n=1 Tax=Madurella mycetomatis TaxID=100816 RepID=A0A175W983_9PEZI|nr:hypothetical protein MMYC01_204136 [Madurella mycetomatis]